MGALKTEDQIWGKDRRRKNAGPTNDNFPSSSIGSPKSVLHFPNIILFLDTSFPPFSVNPTKCRLSPNRRLV